MSSKRSDKAGPDQFFRDRIYVLQIPPERRPATRLRSDFYLLRLLSPESRHNVDNSVPYYGFLCHIPDKKPCSLFSPYCIPGNVRRPCTDASYALDTRVCLWIKPRQSMEIIIDQPVPLESDCQALTEINSYNQIIEK